MPGVWLGRRNPSLLSHLRMGVNLGRVKDIDIRTINETVFAYAAGPPSKDSGAKVRRGDVLVALRADWHSTAVGCEIEFAKGLALPNIAPQAGRLNDGE